MCQLFKLKSILLFAGIIFQIIAVSSVKNVFKAIRSIFGFQYFNGNSTNAHKVYLYLVIITVITVPKVYDLKLRHRVPTSKFRLASTHSRGFLFPARHIFNYTRHPKKTSKRVRRENEYHIDQAITEGFVFIIDPFRVGLFADAVVTDINDEKSAYIGWKLKSDFFTDTYRWFLRYGNNIPKLLRGSLHGGGIGNMYATRRQFQKFVPGIIQKSTSPIINWTWEQDRFLDYHEHAANTFNRFDFKPKNIFDGWWSQEKL